MSRRPTSPSPDLARLEQEGYAVEVRDGFLLLHHIPYVGRDRTVRYGVLVSPLEMNGDLTAPPSDHVARFAGQEPCDEHGAPLEKIINARETVQLAPGLELGFSFSSKPLSGRYDDYHHKMATYAAILATPARVLDPDASATPFPPPGDGAEAEQVFVYPDTASSRAGITAITGKVAGQKIAIVGAGGTGSYILDAVAKTPVAQIHLFDGDVMHSHNAFRTPGAAPVEVLRDAPYKVDYLAALYGSMHRGIVAHPHFLNDGNMSELAEMGFVFIAMDKGTPKQALVDYLERRGIAFVDAGMGVSEIDGALTGQLRVTTSTPGQRHHVHDRQRIPFTDTAQDAYATNIQIADLNMLSAALAVIRWKKLYGFYLDLEGEHFSIYQIDGNILINEDHARTSSGTLGGPIGGENAA